MNANAYTATHDPLTRLPNEFLFLDRLNQTLAISERNTNLFALLLLIPDNLNKILQLHEPAFCDQLVIRLAERLQLAFREPDTISRRQDSSFLILMPQIDSQQALTKLIHRVRKTLAEPFEIDAHGVHMSFSLGKAVYPYDGTTSVLLMEQVEADAQASQLSA
jgi:diguanylate cyclase (GGDEF)-like protein